MARRGMTGQLNMFDLIHSLEEHPGEVEMVSLVPVFEEEPEVEVEPEVEAEPLNMLEKVPVVTDEKVAMSRNYQIAGEKIEIAYINYNKVRILRGESDPEVKEFASTKEAVDYYVEKMQEFEADE